MTKYTAEEALIILRMVDWFRFENIPILSVKTIGEYYVIKCKLNTLHWTDEDMDIVWERKKHRHISPISILAKLIYG